MSTDTRHAVRRRPSRAELAARVDELEDALAEATSEDDTKKMSIIATKGTLDMAYPRSSSPAPPLPSATR